MTTSISSEARRNQTSILITDRENRISPQMYLTDGQNDKKGHRMLINYFLKYSYFTKEEILWTINNGELSSIAPSLIPWVKIHTKERCIKKYTDTIIYLCISGIFGPNRFHHIIPNAHYFDVFF